MLIAKQGRSQVFSSEKERNDFINKEINDLMHSLLFDSQQLEIVKKKISELKELNETIDSEILKLLSSSDGIQSECESIRADLVSLKNQEGRLFEARK